MHFSEANDNLTSIFEWSYISTNCIHDLCLKIIFRCIKTKIIEATLNLNRTNGAESAYKGYFEGYESKLVAASSISGGLYHMISDGLHANRGIS